jgi:hypothetical protein
MALGIDDALMIAGASISLTDTMVQTIRKYRQSKLDYDFEQLIEQVRTETLRKIDDADLALTQFERMLIDRGTDIDKQLADVIASTGFFSAWERHCLKQIRRQFNEFADSVYSSSDDVAALASCRDRTAEIQQSVVETTKAKHDLHQKLLEAPSLREAIALLRSQLAGYKATLSL